MRGKKKTEKKREVERYQNRNQNDNQSEFMVEWFCMSLFRSNENECEYCRTNGTENMRCPHELVCYVIDFAVLPHGHIASPSESGAKPLTS